MSNFILYYAALDQYLAIVFALRYENLITELRIWLLILFTWLLSIVIGALASFVYHVNSNNLWSCNVISTKENDYQELVVNATRSETSLAEKLNEQQYFSILTTSVKDFFSLDTNGSTCTYPGCTDDEGISEYKSDAFAMGEFFLVFLVPTFLLAFCYSKIYAEAHKNSKVTSLDLVSSNVSKLLDSNL